MQIKIDFLQNKKVTVGGVEKEIKEVSYTDESGNTVNATIWRFDKDNVEFPNWESIAPGSTIEANAWKNPEKGTITLYPPKPMRTKPSSMGKPKVDVEGRLKVQEVITKNVEAASDRNMWMWAKYGATELVTNHPSFKFLTDEEIERKIEDLATSIYLMEPSRPF
jgi:hypothetical protein